MRSHIVHVRHPSCSISKESVDCGDSVSDHRDKVTCLECLEGRVSSLQIGLQLWTLRRDRIKAITGTLEEE